VAGRHGVVPGVEALSAAVLEAVQPLLEEVPAKAAADRTVSEVEIVAAHTVMAATGRDLVRHFSGTAALALVVTQEPERICW